MARRDRQRSGERLGRNGKNDGVLRANERGKMMMVRERALMVRKAAVGMRVGLGRAGDADGSRRSLLIEMERREQLKAEVPDKYEEQQHGGPPPEKR